MGKSASKPTVLECMVKNFKKGFSRDYGVKLSPGKLCTLCTLEWPSFGVGWPPEGTLDVFTVTAVYNVITGDPGHPDQFPYIDQWLENTYLRPPWVRFCTTDQGQCRVLVAQSKKKTLSQKKVPPIYQGEPEDSPPMPPPYVLPAPPPGAEGPQMPDSPPPSVSPPPSASEVPEVISPPQPDSPEPMCRRLWSAQGAATPALQMPLWETRGPQQVAPDGTIQEGGRFYYYQPFSTADLLNWKHHTPSYSEKPQALIDLLEFIFQTHCPTWIDCRQLLFTLFDTEERWRIVTEAQKWLQANAGGRADLANWVREAFPEENPHWDYDTEEGKRNLERYRQAFLQGAKAGAKKPTNIAKISEILQEPNESPAKFYERLCEAFRTYTPFDPEAPENQRMINAAFVGQAQSDIRKKLQKLEGFAGENATKLLEIANRVFIN